MPVHVEKVGSLVIKTLTENFYCSKHYFVVLLINSVNKLSVINYQIWLIRNSDLQKWCFDNFLNARNLEYAEEVRKQLANLCQQQGLEPSSCGQNLDQVRKCLISGLFSNVAELQRDKRYLTVGVCQIQVHHSFFLDHCQI